jgi:hypothetical protein
MARDLAEGVKYDDGKLPFDLWSPDALEKTAEVLGYGANKYVPYNWAKGLKYSRVFSALLRHLWAFWRGEDNDSETGFHHLAHAMCCLMFLLHYESRNGYKEFDDRYDYDNAPIK